MKKKLAMLMASLFLVLGTAWAQQLVLNSSPTEVLSSLEDIGDGKCFVMQTADEYGMNLWLKDNGGDNHQMKVDNQLTPQVASSSNYLWKISKSGDNYQVQNVGTGRYFPTFVKNANPSTVEFANAGSFTLVDRSTDGEGKWNFKNRSNAVCLNVSGWWGWTSANPVGWDSEGGNSNYKIFVADVVDLSTLVTVPFNYFVGGEWVAYREVIFTANSPITLGDVPTLTYYQNYTFKEAGDKVAKDWEPINISCEANFPFTPEKGKKYALKSEAGTYFSFNTPTDGTSSAASFSDTPTYFYITVSNTGYTFVDCENEERYIGMNGDYNVGTSNAKWYISAADVNGYVTISKTTENGNLGHNERWTAGTGIFTNVNSSCNKWKLEVENSGSDTDKYANSIPQFTDQTNVIRNNDQYLKALALDKENIFTGGTAPTSVDDMYVLVSTKDIRLTRGSHTFTTTFPNNKTSHILSANLWLDKDGDGTFETHLGTTGASGSNSNDLSTVSFIIPQDTELGATRIRFRLDSSWGIAQSADAAANRMIYDIPVTIIEGGDVEEPEVPVVFNPEADKAYVLNVLGTDKYLDIRTLGNDDPNVSGSNNISTSTKPYPIYFEQGANGTWKMKNANGKYVGLYPNKAWDPVIGELAHEWAITGDANNFTIARESNGSNNFINYDDKAEDKEPGKPLYSGKSTGLQFQLLNYDDVDFITGAGLGKEGAESPYVAIKEIDADGTTTTLPVGMGWILTVEVENPNGASHGQWGSSILATGKAPFPYKDKHNGFQLYLQSGTNDRKKLDVVFGNADHIVNNVDYKGDFKAVITYDGTNTMTIVTTNAEGTALTNTYNLTLPEITEFAYGLPTGINIKRLSIVTIEREYTFAIGTKPEDQEVSVTYDGKDVAAGATFSESELNLDLFAATEIEGYTWKVVADKATNTLTLNYTEAKTEDLQAVKDLVNRIGGDGTADKFSFVHAPWLNSKQETFVLGATEDYKILIKGTTISAITTGLGWYLNNVAHINIAWNSLNEKTAKGGAYVDLTNIELPLPAEETHSSDAKYRYYLNTCTFGYSMTSWTWKRWQQEIDWMALHGINMPLQLVGLEEVWRTFLTMEDANGNRKYGYTDEEAKAFVAGPAFIAWWAMNNLEGWGGTAAGKKSGGTWEGAGGVQDDAWYARQKELASNIVNAQRALGMQPVIPGWSGMVPTNFASKSGYATRGNGGNWAGDFVRPLLLNTSVGKDKYAEIAADYYECLHAVMGESKYYSMDPFHEGGGAGTMEDYEALYAAMETANKGSQWVIQQWQWSATQKYSLSAVPAGRLIVLDLFSDGSPAFDGYNGYAPQDAVFCAIPNFGGRSGLMGRLQNVTDNYFKFKGKYKSIKGIGTAPEAIEQTPVTYDLIYQLPWMNGQKPDVANWVNNYAVARYGKDNAIVKEAWSLLRQGPLNYGADGIQGPVEDVWAARPNLNANAASFWGKTLNNGTASSTYTKERRQMLIDAVYKLIDQKEELALAEGSVYESNYLYDLVEFGGGVMADYAYDLLKGIKEAKNAGNTALYEARRDAFLQLILDMDTFRGTNLNFRLGKWTQEARSAAGEVKDATTATADWYEYNNARTIVSTWSSPNTNLNDYSYRSWQGLLKDLYYPRWKHYFENNCPDNTQYGYFEWNWAHGKEHYVGQTSVSTKALVAGEQGHTDSYTREPEGNTIEEAKKMLAKYIIPVKNAEGKAYYAYRTFETDLTDKASVTVPADATVDFTQFFNVPADATVTGAFLNGVQSAPICAVPVTSTGTYTGTITLTDGTVLKNFTVKVKVGAIVAGYYHINWKKSEDDSQYLFIGHNAVTDDGNAVGYKMLAEGQYTTEAAADSVFALVPQGNGFAISAQGKYLKSPVFTGWKHVMFSDNAGEAGVYVFNEVEGLDGVFNIQGQGAFNANKGENPHALHNDYFQVYGNGENYIIGNNPVGLASPFTLTPATTYPVVAGKTALCLPFNVKLPEGVVAYDIVEATEETLKTGEGLLTQIAVAGDILKAGTPVILVANEAASLTIVMDGRGAKTSLDGSLLEGNFVKQTVKMGDTKKFILNKEGKFEAITINTEMPANSCWVVTTIEDENAHIAEGHIIIDGWEFTYTDSLNNNRITLKDCVKKGDPDLNIGSTYVVDSVEKTVVAISTDFLHGDTTLTSVEIPATMTNLGFRVIEPMFSDSYQGQPGDGGVYNGPIEVSQEGANRYYEFPFDPDTDPQSRYQVDGSFAWRLTLDVAIDTTKKSSFNNYGSAIVSSNSNSLADSYNGYMQIYMWEDLQHIVVKIDNNDDRYSYSTEALDENGNVLKAADGSDSLLVNTHFKFELEHDGAGGYQVVVTYANGKQKMYAISAGMSNLEPFNTLYYSLPEGIKVDVKFEKLISNGLFVNCTNLKEIKVADGNPTFMACEHGVLYDKSQYYVMRIPEAGGHVVEGDRAHFSIPSKVVKLYPGAVHGVNADIVLHSNPQIGVVKGHEKHVANAKFYLSLDDKDNTIVAGETGYRETGGARDFVSTNRNFYRAARYKRAPLANKDVFGTFMLPFAPTNATEKYDFFKIKSATIGSNNEESYLTFTQVESLEANTPYIYRLKENATANTDLGNGGNDNDVFEGEVTGGFDVFELADTFTVKTLAKYNPNEQTGVTPHGAFVNYYIETNKYPNSHYYLYQSSDNMFHCVTQKLTYRPYRAFFVWVPEAGQAAPSKLSMRIVENDGSITEIDPSQIEGWEEPVYYDLQGRRVLNPTNGIYIVNGRKVVIK